MNNISAKKIFIQLVEVNHKVSRVHMFKASKGGLFFHYEVGKMVLFYFTGV